MPSWSQIRFFPADAHKVPSGIDCNPPNASFRDIVVETVPKGVWKGCTLLKVSCGQTMGVLFFNERSNLLRYAVAPGIHQEPGAASISTSVR